MKLFTILAFLVASASMAASASVYYRCTSESKEKGAIQFEKNDDGTIAIYNESADGKTLVPYAQVTLNPEEAAPEGYAASYTGTTKCEKVGVVGCGAEEVVSLFLEEKIVNSAPQGNVLFNSSKFSCGMLDQVVK